ncbi:O-antigen biosynthesis protein WbqP [Pelosinus fermentans]|uniref:sugar transferase n=1 Tax=Pelosinus fermentans TaxID=365349 RepID=UPI0002685C20|nr:sugar transferase [Pelosinus fermentans]OAM92774.1 sugar transferase [Pelosinus fermentans DSM 17108]SDQ56422.1 O-antigen biosynthesis protein WbqP [Pelosinus fermentans]
MIKRTVDIIFSLIAITILMPFLVVVAIWVRLDSHGPILFVQRRIGVDDVEFLMYKFRTMKVGTPEVATDKLQDSQSYITKLGYYLRKYSVDELPQFFNVLLGDMSLVGPRPALYNQSDLRQMRKYLGIDKIKPGVTGWAQVNGRDEILLDQKVQLDSYYLQKQSLFFDLKILIMTVLKVYSGDGVSKTTPVQR